MNGERGKTHVDIDKPKGFCKRHLRRIKRNRIKADTLRFVGRDLLAEIRSDRMHDQEMWAYDNCQDSCCASKRRIQQRRWSLLVKHVNSLEGISVTN